MYKQSNLSAKSIAMSLPTDTDIAVGSPFKFTDINLLAAAVNILETQFSNNCNCAQNTNKCQSCQTATCQSCQSQCHCNCNCNCCASNDDGSNY